VSRRCRYEDCVHNNPVAADDEQVTCSRCRAALGLPQLAHLRDLAQHLSADVHSDDALTVKSIERRLYKDTSCGAWIDLKDRRCVVVGTIIEGSCVEPMVSPRRLWYPFPSDLLDDAIEAIEKDADVVWAHINECPSTCGNAAVGEEDCGVDAHVGHTVIDLNKPETGEEHDEWGELRRAALDHKGRP
jgi:hypothetical protein